MKQSSIRDFAVESVKVKTDQFINETLSKFNLTSLRQNQGLLLTKLIDDRPHALLTLRTGYGKSLLFQLPALYSNKLTVENQLAYLRSLKIPSDSINSSNSKTYNKNVLTKLSTLRLLYVTPELLVTKSFVKVLNDLNQKNMLDRLVIDEAHCISEWGQSFPKVPITCLTATATLFVQEDILKSLNLDTKSVFKFSSGFDRVKFKKDTINSHEILVDYLNSLYIKRKDLKKQKILPLNERVRGVCGIIYCATRTTCDSVAEYLKSQGINAKSYHSGLTPSIRSQTLQSWTLTTAMKATLDQIQTDIVVATISFGMGIDKANVRFVIHYDLPKTFESWYQESGRAGRDNEKSDCVLFYSRQDLQRVQYFLQLQITQRDSKKKSTPTSSNKIDDKRSTGSKSLEMLAEYCENVDVCRHKLVLEYFSNTSTTDQSTSTTAISCNQMCDVCIDKKKVGEQKREALALPMFNEYLGLETVDLKTAYYDDFYAASSFKKDTFYLRDGTMASNFKGKGKKRGWFDQDESSGGGEEGSGEDEVSDGEEEGFEGFKTASTKFEDDKASKRLFFFGKKEDKKPEKVVPKKEIKKRVYTTKFEPALTIHDGVDITIDVRHQQFEFILKEMEKASSFGSSERDQIEREAYRLEEDVFLKNRYARIYSDDCFAAILKIRKASKKD